MRKGLPIAGEARKEQTAMPISILIADDHKVLRECLSSVLAKVKGMKVTGDADNGKDALKLALKLKPDVILMDVKMPEMNGAEATRRILAKRPKTRVIALSGFSDDILVADMLAAGASGYLLKDCGVDDIVNAVKAVVSGETSFSPRVHRTVINGFVNGAAAGSPLSCLTPTEEQVAARLAKGLLPKEIAGAMGRSPETIATHRKNIMNKLGIKSLPELTALCIRHGLVPATEC